MKKNQILIILILIAGICSCEKDTTKYPITYTSYSIADPTIKVYSRFGEVTSPVLVNNILSRYQNQLNKLENDKIKGKVVVTYVSQDSAELTIDNIKEDKLRSVHEIAGVIYLEKQDTSVTALNALSIQDYYKYNPIYYEEFPAPPGSGYNKISKYKDCYYIIKDRGKLNIPMFDFLLMHNLGAPDSGYKIFGNTNSFNEARLGSSILTIDTIIIQQYFIEIKVSQ